MMDDIVDLQHIADTLDACLGRAMPAAAFDIDCDTGKARLVVSTDEWDLTIERGTALNAWLAIDDEPDSPSGYGRALQSVLGKAALTALAEADSSLDGSIAGALHSIGDPFSVSLATELRELQGKDPGAGQ